MLEKTLLDTHPDCPYSGAVRDELDAAGTKFEEVDLALLRLRMEYRQAFMLFHDQELSYEEIAAALDRPLGTVKTWIHRARIELIRILRDRGIIEASGHSRRQTREAQHAVSQC